MWADIVLRAEQQHLLRLMLWAALSIIAGTAVATILAVRRVRSPLLVHFAIQMASWGLICAIIAVIGWRNAHLRDLAAATRLERFLWLNVGLDAGYVAAGATLALCGWILARRLAPVGAGVGVIVQGIALLVLDLRFVSIISR